MAQAPNIKKKVCAMLCSSNTGTSLILAPLGKRWKSAGNAGIGRNRAKLLKQSSAVEEEKPAVAAEEDAETAERGRLGKLNKATKKGKGNQREA
jgi:hypothetical protein